MSKFAVRAFVVAGLLVALMAAPVWARTKIHMVTYGDAFGTYRNIENAFNASHPDYELVIDAYPYGEYIAKITVMILAGAPPDVFQTWAQNKPAWVEDGLLLDITPYWEKSEIAQNSDLYPFIMEAGMYNGRFYGVPHDFNSFAMVVHNDAFNRAGLGVPVDNWTVDDMMQYAIKLNDPQANFYGVQLIPHWSVNNWQWSVLYNGQGWLNDARTEVLVDGPESIEMLDIWYDMVHSRGVAPNPNQPTVLDQWQGGFGMWLGWTGWAFRLADDSPYEWSLATMPKGPAGQQSFAQGHMWSVASNAADPDKSWVVLEWLLSDEGQEAIVVYDNRQPMSNNPDLWGLFFSRLPGDKQRPVQDFIMNTLYGQDLIHNINFFPSWPQMDGIMNRHLQSIFYDQEVPSNAMKRAAQEMRVLLEGAH